MAAPALDLQAIDRLARAAGHAAVVQFRADNPPRLAINNEDFDYLDEVMGVYEHAYTHILAQRSALDEFDGSHGLLAAYSDPLVYSSYDETESGDGPNYQEILYDIVEDFFRTHIPHTDVAIRGMPAHAIQMVLAHIDRGMLLGFPEARESDEDSDSDWEDRVRKGKIRKRLYGEISSALQHELSRRAYNHGRTLYLQTNAARGVEDALHRSAGYRFNATPLQTLVANFLSLSFNGRNPVHPRPPRAAVAQAHRRAPKRKGDSEDEEEEEKSHSRQRK